MKAIPWCDFFFYLSGVFNSGFWNSFGIGAGMGPFTFPGFKFACMRQIEFNRQLHCAGVYRPRMNQCVARSSHIKFLFQ
jgi:hypothetical protein